MTQTRMEELVFHPMVLKILYCTEGTHHPGQVFKGLFVCLFLREAEDNSVHWLAEAKSPEFHSGLPHGWQQPKSLIPHLLP